MPTRPLIALAAVLVLAGPAQAQNGVTVDPGSPTGKEYAIPLDAARRDAAPGGDGRRPLAGRQRDAPLFGEGVGDDGAGSEAAAEKAVASHEPDAVAPPSKARRRPAPPSRAAPRSPPSSARPRPCPRAGSSPLTIVAVALSVLLLGAVIGSIARRRGT